MLDRWARFVHARRWIVLSVSAVVLVASLAVVLHGARLTTGTVRGVESDTALRLVDGQLRLADTAGFTVVFHKPGATVDDEPFRDAVQRALAPLRHHPDVLSVRSPFDDDTSSFLASSMQSVDATRALATVVLRPAALDDTRRFPALRALMRAPGVEMTFSGPAVYKADLDRVLQEDLVRAEVISTPVTVLVLVLVFGSLVAALLPVGVGSLAVLGGIAAVMLLARATDVASYAINIVSLVGLGVAIDYSLFILNRYREELGEGLSEVDALARSLSTAGRAVAFSGLAVAIGLSGLLFFRGSYLASLGMGGTVVVVFAVVYALTFLPALLAAIGPRVHRGRVRLPKLKVAQGFWHRMATWVMRHPVLVLIPTLAALLALGHPFLDLRTAIPDLNVLPPRALARVGQSQLEEHFPERVATRVVVVARFPGDPLTRERVGAMYDLQQRLATLPEVDHVEGPVGFDPMLDREGYQTLLAIPRAELQDPASVVVGQTVGRNIAVFSVVTDRAPASPEARALVRRIRTQRRVGDGEVMVTGQTAMDVDTADFIVRHAPKALAFVVGMTMLVLFLLLGSVVLPFKAVLMNLLSITGSFGALVWIFQKGHLSHLLNFTPGPIDPSLPIVMFCATFGLSMDYEVLLLTRMQEQFEEHGDNTRAVAEGLEHSAKLITSAAAIMVVVFSAFAMADIILLKAVGVGMAIAVTLDATVVRLLLVPATMRLFGALNWWGPAFFQRLARRVQGEH